MDYGRIYREFLADRRLREPTIEVFEKHHIRPRSLGGSNDPENIIRLSPEDHVFAHALLAKIHGGFLIGVVVRMSGMDRYIGRRSRFKYGQFRRAHGEIARKAFLERWADPEKRTKMLAALQTPEARAARGKAGRKRWSDPAVRAAHADFMRQKWADPDASKNLREGNAGGGFNSESARALWQNEKYRAKRAKKMKTPKTRARLAVTMTRLHADPVFHAAAMERLSSPEVRAKRSAAMFRRHAERRNAQDDDVGLLMVCLGLRPQGAKILMSMHASGGQCVPSETIAEACDMVNVDKLRSHIARLRGVVGAEMITTYQGQRRGYGLSTAGMTMVTSILETAVSGPKSGPSLRLVPVSP